MKSSSDTVESDILERLFAPSRPTFSTVAAKAILKIRFPAAEIKRMNQLAKKAQLGTLNKLEQKEIEGYERIGHFVSLMKSKARRLLQSNNGK